MTLSSAVLQPPDSFDQSSSMWVDEAIWGHRLYDEQLPWFVFLEFLNVLHHEADTGRAFAEPGGFNTLKYRARHRLYLRNILFNNPHLGEIRQAYPDDDKQWHEWLKRMKGATGIAHAEFDYLRKHFHSFAQQVLKWIATNGGVRSLFSHTDRIAFTKILTTTDQQMIAVSLAAPVRCCI